MEWQAFLQGLHKKIRELSLINDDEINKKRSESNIISLLQSNKDIRELILMWFNSHDKSRKFKCDIKAKCLKNDGNDAFKNKDYGKSIKFYTESAKSAGIKSNDFAIALANRSAAYFHLDQYNHCISDISLVLELNYPKELLYKIHLRAAQCYFKLQEYEKAKKELIQTKESVVNNNKISKSCKENLFSEISKLSSFIEDSKNIKEVEDADKNDKEKVFESNFNPIELISENVDFPSASTALNRAESPSRGRFVVAKNPIKKGDVLFVEKPFAFVPLDHVNSDIICSQCCRIIEDYEIPCRGCTGISYCSQKCWNESWTLYHKWECSGYEIDLWKQIGIAHLAIRVFLISSATSDINKFNAVQSLVTNIDKLLEDDLIVYSITAMMLTVYLEKYTDFFKTVNLNDSIIKKFENNETNLTISTAKHKEIFVASLLLKHMLQLVANGHAITKLNLTRQDDDNIFVEEQERIAVGIYPSISMLNHSCDPTIINTFWNDYLIVKAIKDVAIGEEIFNCYGPHYRRMPLKERQKALKSQYCFECNCLPCTNPNLQFFLERFNAFKCSTCDEPMENIIKTKYKCLNCGYISVINEINNIKLIKKLFNSADNLIQLKNNHNEAINYLIQCLKIQQKIFYKYHDDITNTLDTLGKLNIIMNNKIQSIYYLEQCLYSIEQKFGFDSIEIVNELNKITDICFQYLQEQKNHTTTTTYRNVMKKTQDFIQRANEIIQIISGPWDDLYKEFNEKNVKLSNMLKNDQSTTSIISQVN